MKIKYDLLKNLNDLNGYNYILKTMEENNSFVLKTLNIYDSSKENY